MFHSVSDASVNKRIHVVTHSESHATSAVSVLESREKIYIKAINNTKLIITDLKEKSFITAKILLPLVMLMIITD